MKEGRISILRRVIPIYIAVALFGTAIIARIAYIQFAMGDELIKQAIDQATGYDTLYCHEGKYPVSQWQTDGRNRSIFRTQDGCGFKKHY
jgi:hypothetical protein